MKQRVAACAIWSFALIAAEELVRVAEHLFAVPVVGPETTVVLGETPGPLQMLASTLLIFFVAGAVVAWSMRGSPMSVTAAMALGAVFVAFDVAVSFPWYLSFALRADTPIYVSERWLGFVGALAPPLGAGTAAYFLRHLRRGASG